MLQGVIKFKQNFKLKNLKFCCIFSIMMITVLPKAIFYTYNLEKMHFKCLNLILK